MITVAVFGAGGSMGTRLSSRLRSDPEYRLLFIEGSEAGAARVVARGDRVTHSSEALGSADVVVLAVPDRVLLGVAAEAVPQMKGGALLICLDPAAPYTGRLPPRKDVSYFVTHPAHPPIFNDETDPEARGDFFGSGKAKQAIVSALLQGPEEHYAMGERISAKVFGPVLRSHRVTVHQMAILEPVLSETVAASCLSVIREAMDEAVRRGVPRQAAFDFLMGHLNIELAILFEQTSWKFSAGCQQAIADGKRDLFRDDWIKVFEEDHLRASVARITGVGP